MLRRFAAGLIALLVVSACAMEDSLDEVYEGMSQAQLEAVLGRPDTFVRRGDYKGFQYLNRRIESFGYDAMMGLPSDRADYGFVFKDDHLVEWGAGQVRRGPQSNNVQTLILFPM
jgi:hypothetical protein